MKTTHLAEQTRLSDIFKGTFYWNYPWFDPQGRQKVFCKKSWIKKGKISKRLTTDITRKTQTTKEVRNPPTHFLFNYFVYLRYLAVGRQYYRKIQPFAGLSFRLTYKCFSFLSSIQWIMFSLASSAMFVHSSVSLCLSIKLSICSCSLTVKYNAFDINHSPLEICI